MDEHLEEILGRHQKQLKDELAKWAAREREATCESAGAVPSEPSAGTSPSLPHCVPFDGVLPTSDGSKDAAMLRSRANEAMAASAGSTHRASSRHSMLSTSSMRRPSTVRPTQFVSARRKAEYMSSLPCLKRFVMGRMFERASGALILASAVTMGVQTQMRAEHFVRKVAAAGSPEVYEEPAAIFIVQVLLAAAFTMELMLRWAADGFFGFFLSPDRSWHLFDIFVVTVNILEILGEVAGVMLDDVLVSPSAVRCVRLLRVVRLIRVMRFFRELRLMLHAILRCGKLLCWVLLTLLLVLFIFGLSITTGTSDFFEGPESATNPHTTLLVAWFGTLDRSMFSLFQASYGGRSWAEFCEVLVALPSMYLVLFMVYVSFSLLAVVNVITGIFVDSALQCDSADKENIVSEEMQSRRRFEDQVRDMFEELDHSGEGQLSWDEFEAGLQDDRVVAFFDAMKLGVGEAAKLFSMIDIDNSGSIDLDEFLSGCHRLRGESRAYDQAVMYWEIKRIGELVKRLPGHEG
mmetsp:Transcript_572/g.1944  ORF Transcript_572/g.1944 Transcript_572/m.1944 type:complete len:520 (+) Transcript_572:78-1637(+)